MKALLASVTSSFVLLAACSTDGGPVLVTEPDSSVAPDPGLDAAIDSGESAADAGGCVATFGDALTAPFGRLDGTVIAIVEPGVKTCGPENGDHAVVQVLAGGAAYRMVVNVQSDRGTDLAVRYRSVSHALVGPAWAEGWHTDVSLDYVNDLGVHSTDSEWQPQDLATVVQSIEAAVPVGQTISAYASTDGGSGAHLVHRNKSSHDGALVLGPDTATPTWVLFHFATQTF